MYINPDQYAREFREIQRRSISNSTCKLVMFVSCLDIDAICTARILSQLLRKELIQYQLIPVVGYNDLKVHYQDMDEEVSSIILIGCGSSIDLEAYLEINPEQYSMDNNDWNDHWRQELQDDVKKHSKKQYRRKIYVLDGHRPWNLDNLFNTDMVVCFDDGTVDNGLHDERDAYLELVQLYAADEGDTDADSESESEAVEDLSDEQIESDDDDDVRNYKIMQNRKRQQLRAKHHRNALEIIIQDYYNQGSTVATSTSSLIYALMTKIGETSIDNLWLAIVGTSSLDSNYPQVYDKLQPIFRDEVHRLVPSSHFEDNEKTADTMTLTVERDYHLFLLRHWTLYDSFTYSSMVNAKLNLWTQDGKKRLHKMLAKMGVSLAVAQQKWLYMDVRIKKQLPYIFSKYLPVYGLEGIVREGFFRYFGYTVQLSAMECVEALTALLETSANSSTGVEEELDNGTINKNIVKREQLWIENFWRGWDALDLAPTTTQSALGTRIKGYDLLLEGLGKAKEVQQIVFRTGMSLLERKLIKNLRLYRLCVLYDNAIPDLAVFVNPLMLAKLGTWLLDNLTEVDYKSHQVQLKPLVVASLDVNSDTYMVMGLAPKYPRDMDASARARLIQQGSSTTRLNTFSVAFKELAASSGAKVRVDSFNSAAIEIRKDDLSPFLEKLTLSGII
ncbi:cell division control protein 45 [Diutina rugosa]